MTRRNRKHSRKHRNSRKRRMTGGNSTSATTYAANVVGGLNSQFARTFDQSGAYGNIQGARIIGTSGQNTPTASQMPSASQMRLIQSAGNKRKKRGGFVGQVINQAIVPFGLLGMQQMYDRKRKKTYKNRRYN